MTQPPSFHDSCLSYFPPALLFLYSIVGSGDSAGESQRYESIVLLKGRKGRLVVASVAYLGVRLCVFWKEATLLY